MQHQKYLLNNQLTISVSPHVHLMWIRGMELSCVQAGFAEAREFTLVACLGEWVSEHVSGLAEMHEDVVVVDQVAQP